MHRRQFLNSLWAVSLCAGCADAAHAAEGSHWGYAGDAGPEHWGKLGGANLVCSSGGQQSPIDLSGVIRAAVPLPRHVTTAWGGRIVNNGHTIQIDTLGDPITRLGTRRLKLLQLHFHAPSEHTIAGRRFPMEAHFVHQDVDGSGLVVIGVMLAPGRSNSVFKSILDAAPTSAGSPVALKRPIRIRGLMPRRLSYFSYEGSLTTPPCSEQVTWIVARTPVQVASADIARFTALYTNNARPVQALNRRFLLSSF